LAERRTGIDSFDFNNPRLDGTPVSGHAFGWPAPCNKAATNPARSMA